MLLLYTVPPDAVACSFCVSASSASAFTITLQVAVASPAFAVAVTVASPLVNAVILPFSIFKTSALSDVNSNSFVVAFSGVMTKSSVKAFSGSG